MWYMYFVAKLHYCHYWNIQKLVTQVINTCTSQFSLSAKFFYNNHANTEIIVPGVHIIQQYITTVSNCYLFDRLTVVLTVRSATSITTSSTPGNSLISFFFTENKHEINKYKIITGDIKVKL